MTVLSSERRLATEVKRSALATPRAAGAACDNGEADLGAFAARRDGLLLGAAETRGSLATSIESVPSDSASMRRARKRRLITVPTGTPRKSAASRYEKSRRSTS